MVPRRAGRAANRHAQWIDSGEAKNGAEGAASDFDPPRQHHVRSACPVQLPPSSVRAGQEGAGQVGVCQVGVVQVGAGEVGVGSGGGAGQAGAGGRAAIFAFSQVYDPLSV